MPNYDEIVPQEYQNELLQIAASTSNNSWRLGDICNYVELITESKMITQVMVQKAVASFAGKASRTIREYACIAKRYPVEVRQRFDVLSFDHFRNAMRFSDRDLDALQWAVDQTLTYNRPGTVDAMVNQFETPQDAAPEDEPPHPEIEVKSFSDPQEEFADQTVKEFRKVIADLEQVVSRETVTALYDLLKQVERELNLVSS